jgi:hypothetical protein
MKVIWKPILAICILDADEIPRPTQPESFDGDGSLLEKIQAMPQGRPINLQAAFLLAQDEFFNAMEREDFAAVDQLIDEHWTESVSRQGYRIILNGSEYEVFQSEASQ